MSRFFGIKYQENNNIPDKFCRSAIGSFDLQSYDTIQEIHFKNFSFVSITNTNDPIDMRETSTVEKEKFILHINGRLDHEKLIKAVDNDHSKLVEIIQNDINLLSGDFAIVFFNKRNEELLIMRDPLGTRPIYYSDQDNYFAFASEMKALTALPGFSVEMDEQWIADAISTIKSEKCRTPYKRIYRLLPGHILHYLTKLDINSYWNIQIDNEYEKLEYPQAVKLYKDKLTKAIKTRMVRTSIGSELSGGLDSSGVTVIANKIAKARNIHFHAFTHAFSDQALGKYFPYKDQRELSELLCNHAGLNNHILTNADGLGILETLKNNIFLQSGPVQQGYSLFSESLYKAAHEKGIKILFSGFGGDEGPTSNSPGFFEELVHKKNWKLFKKEILFMKPWEMKQRATIKYIISRYFPFAYGFFARKFGKKDWRESKFNNLGFYEDFGQRLNIENRYYEMVGLPADPDVRMRQYKRIMHNHVSQRFEYSYLAAKARGITYVYPLWDIDLLQFYYSLPAHYKFRDGLGRAIYRDAMKDILPEEIRLRTDKTGTTIPTFYQRIIHDNKKISQLIVRSKEKNKYHYLDYDKMLSWHDRINNISFVNKIPANPGAFINCLQILLLQEMEREGEFKSGIRY